MNFSGKSNSITVITPMKPWRRMVLQLVFWAVGHGAYRAIQQRLIKLSFIHFAHWSIVRARDFPKLSPDQPASDLKYDYLVFCSNFNGTWQQYIGAFSQVIPIGLDKIWKWSIGYPGSVPETPFLAYIRHNQYSSEYYYNATPGASTNDIKSALTLQAAVEQFATNADSIPAEDFRRRFNELLTQVQGNMSTTGVQPWDK